MLVARCLHVHRDPFKIGHADAARKFMKFIQSTFVAEHDTYQIMYGIRGERKLTEVILDHLSGYKNSKPVRIGNDAYHQRQNDSFGYLMDLIPILPVDARYIG